MIVYRCLSNGSVERHSYPHHRSLLELLAQWRMSRIAYYSHERLRGIVYLPAVHDHVPRDGVAFVPMSPGINVPSNLLDWVERVGWKQSYVPLTETLLKPQPNSGSQRTPTDLGSWMDTTIDALTRYHILVNGPQPNNNNKATL